MTLPRFHLSTALVMMLAAGLFLGLNLRPAHDVLDRNSSEFKEQLFVWSLHIVYDVNGMREWPGTPPEDATTIERIRWGFPANFREDLHFRLSRPFPPFTDFNDVRKPNYFLATLNAVFAVFWIVIVGIISERLIRHNSKKSNA